VSVGFVYCRVSTEDQADRGVSLEVQETDCRAWCAREGLEVELFVDAASGRTMSRPALQQLLGRLEEADALIVWRVDRLSRDSVDRGLIIRELRRQGVRFVAVQQPELGGDTPEADLVGNVLGAVAEFESALLGARVKAARDRIAASGRPLGAPPYGYRVGDAGWEVVREEAETIEQVDRLFLAGWGTTRICQQLNRLQIPGPGGGRWWPSAVRHLLCRPIYAGQLHWGATRKLRGQRIRQPDQPKTVAAVIGVPPIREEAVWQQIRRMMTAKTVNGRAGPVSYPFTPVLRCGRCGSGMSGRTWHTKRGQPVRSYRCARSVIDGGHPGSYLREDLLIGHVSRFLTDTLQQPIVITPLDPGDTAAEIARIDRRRQRLIHAYTQETISLQELQEQTGRLTVRRQILEARSQPEQPITLTPAEAVRLLTLPDNRDHLRAWVLQTIRRIEWDGQQLNIHLAL
jgi:site-specific DNA recombinase